MISNIDNYKYKIICCYGTGCLSLACKDVFYAFKDAIESKGLKDIISVIPSGCMGLCSLGPLTRIETPNDTVLYGNLEPILARLIVSEHIVPVVLEGRDLNDIPEFLNRFTISDNIVFFKKQKRFVLNNFNKINPLSIDSYIAVGGYSQLKKALDIVEPFKIIELIDASGLKGRGGAGFPTGEKLYKTYKSVGGRKFVICNGDEGDPGAFVDRSILEGNPHGVLEGMIISGYAIGATRGYFHIRAEYSLAIERVNYAIEEAYSRGYLGKNILGSNFSFDCSIRYGAGAFVCGEETALIAALEGRRGMPRPRPPYPYEEGLWGEPTLINNVETLANIPKILEVGAKEFRDISKSKIDSGTKVFSLAGKAKNSGLIEVPMGITLREIIEDIANGSSTGKRVKAVQLGGPSGAIIPEDMFDLKLEYEELKKIDSVLGSGGLILFDEDDDMVEIALFYMSFAVEESCGKCAPCRIGTKQLQLLLRKVLSGEGSMEDLKMIEMISEVMENSSLCGFGKKISNPVISTLKYFREEYLEKIKK